MFQQITDNKIHISLTSHFFLFQVLIFILKVILSSIYLLTFSTVTLSFRFYLEREFIFILGFLTFSTLFHKRVARIELASSVWKTEVIPLYDTSMRDIVFSAALRALAAGEPSSAWELRPSYINLYPII